ncbi:hypothetical protein A5876_003066, partial [Enterococcus sp. 3C8_DIV0646]
NQQKLYLYDRKSKIDTILNKWYF